MATAISTIKQWFKTGLKPTQSQFWAWLDSYWHKDETIPQDKIENLTSSLNGKLSASKVVTNTESNTTTEVFSTSAVKALLENYEGGGGGEPVTETYNGNTPTTVQFGALSPGYDPTGKTWVEIIQAAAAPVLAPAFSSFAISGQSTSIEVGTTLSGNKSFTFGISNIANADANSLQIIDVTDNNTALASALPLTSPQSVAITTVTKNTEGNQVWNAKITFNGDTVSSSNYTVNWRYKNFYGAAAAAPADSAAVRALPSSSYTNSNTLNLATGNTATKFYVAIIATKQISSVIDTGSGFDITAAYTLINAAFTVNDAGGNAVTYKLYEHSVAVPYSGTTHQITLTNA